MKTSVSPARLAVLPLALSGVFAAAFPSLAQTVAPVQVAALGETVVTATRTAQPLSDLVADVSIVDRDSIERSGATGLGDLLARLPGVEMSRNGGPGTTTSIFIRGSETRHSTAHAEPVDVKARTVHRPRQGRRRASVVARPGSYR